MRQWEQREHLQPDVWNPPHNKQKHCPPHPAARRRAAGPQRSRPPPACSPLTRSRGRGAPFKGLGRDIRGRSRGQRLVVLRVGIRDRVLSPPPPPPPPQQQQQSSRRRLGTLNQARVGGHLFHASDATAPRQTLPGALSSGRGAPRRAARLRKHQLCLSYCTCDAAAAWHCMPRERRARLGAAPSSAERRAPPGGKGAGHSPAFAAFRLASGACSGSLSGPRQSLRRAGESAAGLGARQPAPAGRAPARRGDGRQDWRGARAVR